MKQSNAIDHNAHPSTLPKQQRGTALIEFSILSPLLFLLLFGFTETGRLLYQQNQLTKQVTTGARYIARIPDAVNTDDCSIGPGWAAAVASAQILVAQSVNGDPVLPGLVPADVSFNVIALNVSTPACVIQAEVETGYITIFGDSPPPFFNIGPIVLNTAAEERFLGL
jgi:Flp pilus assembly protein TadG